MKINFTDFLFAMSFALDAVEKEVNGANEGHGKRVAYLTHKMLSGQSFSDEKMMDICACAILHDNGLSKMVRDERDMLLEGDEAGLEYHSRIGEEALHFLPLSSNVENIVLYHHENADGSGPFHKKEGETNLVSEVIHLADNIDVSCDWNKMTPFTFTKLCERIKNAKGTLFTKNAVELFLNNISWNDVEVFQRGNLDDCLHRLIPSIEKDYSDTEVENIAQFFARIVDYKSSFTKDHSMGVAHRAKIMAQYYHFDHEKQMRFYFAGAMHDIGKLVVTNDILEKPGKLTTVEFQSMKNHASVGYYILKSIHGFDDIAEWAGNHHEKLNGIGYSRGLTEDVLTMEDRLMACIDIYQALIEPRPYKQPMSHEKTIAIMREMVSRNQIDAKITEDMNEVFSSEEFLAADTLALKFGY